MYVCACVKMFEQFVGTCSQTDKGFEKKAARLTIRQMRFRNTPRNCEILRIGDNKSIVWSCCRLINRESKAGKCTCEKSLRYNGEMCMYYHCVQKPNGRENFFTFLKVKYYGHYVWHVQTYTYIYIKKRKRSKRAYYTIYKRLRMRLSTLNCIYGYVCV